MAKALGAFAKAVNSAQRKDVALASRQLEPAFEQVLHLFGNFESAQTYFAQQ